jgi:Kip1 ubiquitination-promoting complex protein 1
MGKNSYGRKWETGDLISCLLDLDEGTLSYAINGEDLGVAFISLNQSVMW